MGPLLRCTSTAVFAALLVAGRAGAQGVTDLVPATAANCALTAPPSDAGIAPTPGGFVMVHPRNDALPATYTGCKILWVVDVDRMLRLATLYFESGALVRALAHDTRDPQGAVEAACDLRAGRSLRPNAGQRATDATCESFPTHELYGLRMATWPRLCLSTPDAAPCKEDPR